MPLYEHRTQPVLPRRLFVRRLLTHSAVAALLLCLSLGLGVLGYHFLVGLAWIDALLNASMILGGMGPVDAITTSLGKVFASLYALFAGIVFLAVSAIIVAPLAHRLLHRIHAEDSDEPRGEKT
jgi:hypothetical protein